MTKNEAYIYDLSFQTEHGQTRTERIRIIKSMMSQNERNVIHETHYQKNNGYIDTKWSINVFNCCTFT